MTLRAVDFFFVLATLPAAACAPGPTPAARTVASENAASGGAALWGSSWRLEALAGSTVMEGTAPTLQFPESGKVSGNASCNRFFGAVEISGESIRLGAMSLTRKSCGPAVGAQERKYLELLDGAERFTLEGPVLSIYAKGVDQPLRFRRSPPANSP